MNANVQLWLDALRSGNFRQTTGALHKRDGYGDSFCCLGVACKIAQDNGVDVTSVTDHDVVIYDGERGYLPRSVQDWLGIKHSNGGVKARPLYGDSRNGFYSLVTLNDKEFSFGEIADIIESNQEALFSAE